MTEAAIYNVQCLTGNPDHVFGAARGSALEIACKRRADSGLIDALIIQPDECPKCIESDREGITAYFMQDQVDWPTDSKFADQLVDPHEDSLELGTSLEGISFNGQPVYIDA